ncbi:MAG: ABC transporter permease [Bryobacterales bacterium]|nr:ABC transporter permease [Bryobacterales bacterium]
MANADIRENLMVALDTLRAHKVRSALTVLGIVIGVTSVISVASIITGLNGFIAKRVEKMGSRTYMVSRFNFAAGFGRMPENIRRRKYIQPSDADYIRTAAPLIDVITPFTGRPITPGDMTGNQANVIQYGAERVERIILRACEPEFARAMAMFDVANGRFISRFDLEHSRDVVVIGDAIAASLFPGVDPLGKWVRLNGRQMEVIGVFEKDEGMFGGPGVDQIAVLPLTTFIKHYPETREFLLAFTVPTDVDPSLASNQVIEAMRRLRRVPYTAENDFELFSPDFLSSLWNQLTGALVVLTGAISSIGLLIGGVGVMNIMLISVTERTAEIGIRKAIGARRRDIRIQFLLEAMLLSFTGGALGILFGGVIAFAVRTLVPSVPATLSLFWITLGVAISMGVGLFFGYYPASRAANLDPVVCLRYE